MSFEIKTRTWWKANPDWPDGREPGATPWHKARRITTVETEEEAQKFCKDWNATHPPGKLSRKAEYSEV